MVLARRIAMVAGLAALASCDAPRVDDLLLACPSVTAPAELADYTMYRPGAPPDLSNLLFDARLTEARGPCRRARRGQGVEVTLTVGFEVERGPAAQGRGVELPWLLAVVGPDGEVVSRRSFVLPVTFAPNVTRAAVAAAPVPVEFPARQGVRMQDWRIVAGFQLDETALAINRRRGPR
jgi:hypothetical protein